MPSLSHLHWVPLIYCPLPLFPHPHPFQVSPHSGIFSNNLQTPDYDTCQSRVLTSFTNILYSQMVGAGDTSSGQILAVVTLHDSLSTDVEIPIFSVHVGALSSPPMTTSRTQTPAIFVSLRVMQCLLEHRISCTHVRPEWIHKVET